MTAVARKPPPTLGSPRYAQLGYVPRVWVQRTERKVDPLDVIETAYRLDGTDEAWLAGILERFAPAVDEGRGVLAYLYDAAARPLRVWNFVGDFEPTPKEIVDVITSADDDYVAQSYLVTPFGTASEQPGFDRQVTFSRRLGTYGIRDAIAINGVDLIVVPAASVDRTGMRMGWGRGYFDKTLGSMEARPPVYAVVFDSELVDAVPSDVHDQRVNGVVTPTRIVALPTS